MENTKRIFEYLYYHHSIALRYLPISIHLGSAQRILLFNTFLLVVMSVVFLDISFLTKPSFLSNLYNNL